jgi:hypothetical protein
MESPKVLINKKTKNKTKAKNERKISGQYLQSPSIERAVSTEARLRAMRGTVKSGTPRLIASVTGENPLPGGTQGCPERGMAFDCFPGFSLLKRRLFLSCAPLAGGAYFLGRRAR